MTTFPRASPDELAKFNPTTKICVMNCGPSINDPRSEKEQKFLCEDCYQMTPTQIASIQIGSYLKEAAAFLNTLRIDSDGGSLVIGRAANDLEWLAGKLESGDYIAHIPNHMHNTAFTALSEAAIAGQGIEQLLKR